MFKRFRNYIEDRKKGPNIKQEYINANGKVVEKPSVKMVADYDGPDAKVPPKSGKEAPAPYKPANADQKPKKGESGFADEGDSKLIYNPNLKGGNSKLTALGTELGNDWANTKTENFIYKTRKMDSKQFAQYVLKESKLNTDNLPKVNANQAGPFHPHPSEAIRYVAALTQNKKLTENFIHEARRTGTVSNLLEALLDQIDPRTLLQLFKENNKLSKILNKAMSEAVGPPLGISDDDDENSHEQEPSDTEEGDVPPEDEESGDEEAGDEHPDDFEDVPSDDDEENPDEEPSDEEGNEAPPPDEEDNPSKENPFKSYESFRSYLKSL